MFNILGLSKLNSESTNAKEKILHAAIELVTSEEPIESITIRQIAKKAGVNAALINYYYQSKENLLNQVVEIMMGNIVDRMFESENAANDAATRLKDFMVNSAVFGFKCYKLCKIAVAAELKQGCRNTCRMAMPLLKEIFKNKNESELKIIALQLFIPFHNIFLNPEIYSDYLDTDFFDEQQRNHKINQMIDSILLKMEECKHSNNK